MLNKESKIILILTIISTFLFYLGFGWGQSLVDVEIIEGKTNLKDTNSDAIYPIEDIWKVFNEYQAIGALAAVEDISVEDVKLRDGTFYTVPGLKATRTINQETEDIDMCTDMTPQGVTVAEKYLITSAYDHSKLHNSVLYIQEFETGKLVKTIPLEGKPHVGGIAYDDKSKQLWVCGRRNDKSEIFAIALKDIEKYDIEKNKAPIKYKDRLFLNNIKRASYITYYNKSLYVGFFNPWGKGTLKKYEIDEKGKLEKDNILEKVSDEFDLTIESLSNQDTLEKIQGITHYKDYTLLSQSYGPGDSKLYIYEKNLERKTFKESDALITFTVPSHLEQIQTYDGRLYMIFESAAKAYRKSSHNNIDRIISIDLKGFINLVEEELNERKGS